MPKHPFDAIIFDHDGTLIDTEHPDFEACCMLYQELGTTLSLEHWTKHIVGRIGGYDILFQELIERNGNGLSREALWQRLQELWDITLKEAAPMPGVVSLLPVLQQVGYPLAVATGADRAWVTDWLTRFELLPYFEVIANSEDVIHNKPAPDVYLFAARSLGVRPQRCLVFEDSLAGVQAAKAAGMTVIAVPSRVTHVQDFSAADGVVAGLDKVGLAWIEELGANMARKQKSYPGATQILGRGSS
jgi:HAD superfamily hydrolase (TIGR01509 family)